MTQYNWRKVQKEHILGSTPSPTMLAVTRNDMICSALECCSSDYLSYSYWASILEEGEWTNCEQIVHISDDSTVELFYSRPIFEILYENRYVIELTTYLFKTGQLIFESNRMVAEMDYGLKFRAVKKHSDDTQFLRIVDIDAGQTPEKITGKARDLLNRLIYTMIIEEWTMVKNIKPDDQLYCLFAFRGAVIQKGDLQ